MPAGSIQMQRTRADRRLYLPFMVLVCVVFFALSLPDGARSLTLPGETPPQGKGSIKQVLPIARRELRENVIEKRGNNVPRYHDGKGRIAPYSIKAFWCVAFSTWVWSQAGINSYLGTDLLWPSHDGTTVAIQVKDMTHWAKRTGRWSYRARPGYLIAYGKTHMGIVEEADRQGRAVQSIEGNKSDRVMRVQVPMESVSGYISPYRLTPDQFVGKASPLADIE